MTALRVAFRADASPQIGGGHVMRCLTLANRLQDMGVASVFVSASMTDGLRNAIGDARIALIDIPPPAPAAPGDGNWDLKIWDATAQAADAERTATAVGSCAWAIVDHYGLDAHWETAVRSIAGRIAVVDDLANRQHDCDLLVDQTYGRVAGDYLPLTGRAAELLTGASFALLRPEFAAARPAALQRQLRDKRVERVLISLGMTDAGGHTEGAVQAVLRQTDAAIDVVLSGAAPTIDTIRMLADAHPRVRLHVDSPAMCDLMIAADLAIGAAGSTSWERCCLGLPSITIAVAGNQRKIASELAAAGAILLIDAADDVALDAAIGALVNDRSSRVRMARAAGSICDGRGADRVVARMLG